ncbi:hypothetical protein QCA50_009138 [Cerrena zonata]|uniref:Uncharacterized protein n=1 Tax=Cerrena zonata TaxID=2478898 RepID=A0AAW0G991_9APHY
MTKQKLQKQVVSYTAGHKFYEPPELLKALIPMPKPKPKPKPKEDQAAESSDKTDKDMVKYKRKGKYKRELNKKTGVWTVSASDTIESTVREWDATRGKWIWVPETSKMSVKGEENPKTEEYEYEWEYSCS